MDNELIKITTNDEGIQLVSAKDLYEGLKVQQDFSDWIKKQLQNVDAIEDEDFTLLKGKSSGGRPSTDYIITIDIAKEICMVVGVSPRTNSETKKLSKQIRKYFIECEKKLKEISNPQLPQDYLSALKALVASEEEKQRLLEENTKNKPKVDYYENAI